MQRCRRRRDCNQDDTLQQERKRRDRVEQRRQKSILFSKSQELALLERLCRRVAGTLCDTSWDKLFVTDPDVVLASKAIRPHRKDARARVTKTRKTQKNIKKFVCVRAWLLRACARAGTRPSRNPMRLLASNLHTLQSRPNPKLLRNNFNWQKKKKMRQRPPLMKQREFTIQQRMS